MEKRMIKKYLSYLTDRLNDLDYSEIDGFCEDNELSEDDVEELLSIRFSATSKSIEIEED